MSEQQNTKLVQEAYAAFGRGDIAAVIALLDDSIVWSSIHGLSPEALTAGDWRGKSGVMEFFQKLGSQQTFQSFEPQEFIAQGDNVVVIGHYAMTLNSSGKKYASDWVMIFTIKNGKVTRFREFADSAGANAAYL